MVETSLPEAMVSPFNLLLGRVPKTALPITGDPGTDKQLTGALAPVLFYGSLAAAGALASGMYWDKRTAKAKAKGIASSAEMASPGIMEPGVSKVAAGEITSSNRLWTLAAGAPLATAAAIVAGIQLGRGIGEKSTKDDLAISIDDKKKKLDAMDHKQLAGMYPEMSKQANIMDDMIDTVKTGSSAYIASLIGVAGLTAAGTMMHVNRGDGNRKKQKALETLMTSQVIDRPTAFDPSGDIKQADPLEARAKHILSGGARNMTLGAPPDTYSAAPVARKQPDAVF